MKFTKFYQYFFISIAVIAVDQIVKMAVHFSMAEGEHFEVLGDLFKIHYITNEGMAFGLKLGGDYGKIILSLFRLMAIFFIGFYIKRLFDKKSHKGLLVCVALIFGGAMGNLIDSTFYGLIDPVNLQVFDSPTPWFHGKVVDMFFIDIAEGYYPSTWPLVGGQHYSFWPIFNIADASIFIAVGLILFRQKTFFRQNEEEA